MKTPALGNKVARKILEVPGTHIHATIKKRRRRSVSARMKLPPGSGVDAARQRYSTYLIP